MYAIKSIENAFIPPEFEKASTHKPNKNDKNRKGNRFLRIGYKNTKAIYMYGFTYPKNSTLLKINTCNNNSVKNKKAMYSVLFISCVFYFF